LGRGKGEEQIRFLEMCQLGEVPTQRIKHWLEQLPGEPILEGDSTFNHILHEISDIVWEGFR
jgi:hypothetical protein